jgi:hypothetical protein
MASLPSHVLKQMSLLFCICKYLLFSFAIQQYVSLGCIAKFCHFQFTTWKSTLNSCSFLLQVLYVELTPLNEGTIKTWVSGYGSQAWDPHYKCTIVAKCQTHILVMRSSWGVNMVSICTNWAKYMMQSRFFSDNFGALSVSHWIFFCCQVAKFAKKTKGW